MLKAHRRVHRMVVKQTIVTKSEFWGTAHFLVSDRVYPSEPMDRRIGIVLWWRFEWARLIASASQESNS